MWAKSMSWKNKNRFIRVHQTSLVVRSICMKMSDSSSGWVPINDHYVRDVAAQLDTDSFGWMQSHIREQLGGRSLSTIEKNTIERVAHNLKTERARKERDLDSLVSIGKDAGTILMVTAYSDNYTIGRLCEQVNRTYALKQGYLFHSEVCSLEGMTTSVFPKKHCTWFKVKLLMKVLADIEQLQLNNVRYVMWIDADAMVVDHSKSLNHIIELAENRDLIIAEDMNTGCKLNAGVFMLRTTRWSQSLLQEVWDSDKYDEVFFYEQSALISCLRARKEGLDAVSPFHSFLPGAVQGVKLFPHTAVLPTFEFNSNRGIICDDVMAFQAYAQLLLVQASQAGSSASGEATVPSEVHSEQWRGRDHQRRQNLLCACYRSQGNYCSLCQRTAGAKWRADKAGAQVTIAVAAAKLFIFHPAGMSDKLLMLHTAIHKYGVEYDLAGDILLDSQPALPAQSAGENSQCRDEDVSNEAPTAEVAGPVKGSIGTAPMRLVRGKMGQVPQQGQTHLLRKLEALNITG